MRPRISNLTIIDYHIVMNKVRIAELKAKLSQYLRAVRRGESVTVMDRDTPVAIIRPFEGGPGTVTIRTPSPGTPKISQVELPIPLAIETDIVELLLAERQVER